jgi:hypothetical protein
MFGFSILQPHLLLKFTLNSHFEDFPSSILFSFVPFQLQIIILIQSSKGGSTLTAILQLTLFTKFTVVTAWFRHSKPDSSFDTASLIPHSSSYSLVSTQQA